MPMREKINRSSLGCLQNSFELEQRHSMSCWVRLLHPPSSATLLVSSTTLTLIPSLFWSYPLNVASESETALRAPLLITDVKGGEQHPRFPPEHDTDYRPLHLVSGAHRNTTRWPECILAKPNCSKTFWERYEWKMWQKQCERREESTLLQFHIHLVDLI